VELGVGSPGQLLEDLSRHELGETDADRRADLAFGQRPLDGREAALPTHEIGLAESAQELAAADADDRVI
jgi:hypothetical protein